MRIPTTVICCGLLGAVLGSCGSGERSDASRETGGPHQNQSSEAPPQPTAAEPGPQSTTSAPLAVEDVDRWQRGMAAELTAVQEAGQKLKAAKTGQDSLSAVFGANDMTTRAAGARAAGVSEERYQFIRTTLSNAVAQLAPLEAGMKDLPKEMLDQLQKGREQALANMSADLPAPVLEALRPRAAALRQQDMTLAGERLRAAGAV